MAWAGAGHAATAGLLRVNSTEHAAVLEMQEQRAWSATWGPTCLTAHCSASSTLHVCMLLARALHCSELQGSTTGPAFKHVASALPGPCPLQAWAACWAACAPPVLTARLARMLARITAPAPSPLRGRCTLI